MGYGCLPQFVCGGQRATCRSSSLLPPRGSQGLDSGCQQCLCQLSISPAPGTKGGVARAEVSLVSLSFSVLPPRLLCKTRNLVSSHTICIMLLHINMHTNPYMVFLARVLRFIYAYECCLHICMCPTQVPDASRSQKRISNALSWHYR